MKNRNKMIIAGSALAVAAAIALPGCGTFYNSERYVDGLHKITTHFLGPTEDYLVCPNPAQQNFILGDDAFSSFIKLMQQETFENEKEYYPQCVQTVTATGNILGFSAKHNTAKSTLAELIDAKNTQDIARKELESVRAERAKWEAKEAEQKAKQTLYETLAFQKPTNVFNPVYNPTVTNKGGNNTLISSSNESGLNEYKQKLAKDSSNTGLSPEEEQYICNGEKDKVKGKNIQYIGKFEFDDCKYDPSNLSAKKQKEVLSPLERIMQKESKGAILICGSSSETDAKNCQKSIKDYGNGELSGDRAFFTGKYLYENIKPLVKDLTFALFGNKTVQKERKADMYHIK